MNDKFEKDIVEAIESLKEQISEYKEQIEVVKIQTLMPYR